MANKTPFFIVVDGIDGSGKTTIAKYIEEKTQATYMRMVGQGPIGLAIREKLLSPSKNYGPDTEALWIFANNIETIHDCVAPELDRGKSVILDRYWTSTYAYQINRKDDPLFLELFKKVAVESYRQLRPSLYIWCDVDVKTALSRINSRSEQTNHFDTENILDKMKVVEGFDKIYHCDIIENKIKLNCNQSLDTVLKEVDRILQDFFYI